MIGRRAGSGAGEYLGTGLEDGTRHPLGPGDVVHIPAGIPHSFLVPEGKHITVRAREVSRPVKRSAVIGTAPAAMPSRRTRFS